MAMCVGYEILEAFYSAGGFSVFRSLLLHDSDSFAYMVLLYTWFNVLIGNWELPWFIQPYCGSSAAGVMCLLFFPATEMIMNFNEIHWERSQTQSAAQICCCCNQAVFLKKRRGRSCFWLPSVSSGSFTLYLSSWAVTDKSMMHFSLQKTSLLHC